MNGSKQWNFWNAIKATNRCFLCSRIKMEGSITQKTLRKNLCFNFFWKADNSGNGGLGVLVTQKSTDKAISVLRHGIRLIMLQLLCRKCIVNIICNAPQPGYNSCSIICLANQQILN